MKPYVLGLTGSFGSGKSTAAQIFRELGARVIDADRLAHEALEPASPVYAKIKKLFGEVDRKKIAAQIFSDHDQKKKLEALIHPYVFQRIEQEIASAPEKIVVLEVPLLFETGFQSKCDSVAVVSARADIAAERLRQKGYSLEDVEARKSHQMPLEEKEALADDVITNNGTVQELQQQVEKMMEKISSILKRRT